MSQSLTDAIAEYAENLAEIRKRHLCSARGVMYAGPYIPEKQLNSGHNFISGETLRYFDVLMSIMPDVAESSEEEWVASAYMLFIALQTHPNDVDSPSYPPGDLPPVVTKYSPNVSRKHLTNVITGPQYLVLPGLARPTQFDLKKSTAIRVVRERLQQADFLHTRVGSTGHNTVTMLTRTAHKEFWRTLRDTEDNPNYVHLGRTVSVPFLEQDTLTTITAESASGMSVTEDGWRALQDVVSTLDITSVARFNARSTAGRRRVKIALVEAGVEVEDRPTGETRHRKQMERRVDKSGQWSKVENYFPYAVTERYIHLPEGMSIEDATTVIVDALSAAYAPSAVAKREAAARTRARKKAEEEAAKPKDPPAPINPRQAWVEMLEAVRPEFTYAEEKLITVLSGEYYRVHKSLRYFNAHIALFNHEHGIWNADDTMLEYYVES